MSPISHAPLPFGCQTPPPSQHTQYTCQMGIKTCHVTFMARLLPTLAVLHALLVSPTRFQDFKISRFQDLKMRGIDLHRAAVLSPFSPPWGLRSEGSEGYGDCVVTPSLCAPCRLPRSTTHTLNQHSTAQHTPRESVCV